MLLKSISSFLLIFWLQTKLCTPLRILGVFPMNGKSHFVMTGRLMKELAARGHQVDVISVFPQKTPIPNYRDIVVHNPELPSRVNNVTYDSLQKLSFVNLGYFARLEGTGTCKLLEHPAMQEVLKNKKGTYDVIVFEMFVAHCYIGLGQHFDAPMVGMVTSKIQEWAVENMASPHNPSYVPSVFSSFNQKMTFWERLQNTVLTNFITAQMNHYIEKQLNQVEKAFGRKLKSMKELYNDVSLVLVNSHHSINDVRPFNPDIIEVGGLHVVDDGKPLNRDLQQWLDESTHGCVLFTFGSMVKIETYPSEVLKIFYEMFERIAPVRVIWKIVDPSLLPAGLPKNVKTSSWIPQVAALKHKNMKLFITHGGLMGTQEAIVYKVPMVGLPLFADQHMNIKSYAHKKIAVALSFTDLTADILTNAVKTVLNDPTYRKNIEKMSDLFLDRPMSAIDTAVYWVEYTAKHPKVLKSPAMELTWWQFYLLDVYGFMFACLLIVLFVIKKIVGFLRKILCSQERGEDFMKLKKKQ